MPWTSRDSDGNINGEYRNETPGRGQVFLPEDDAELVAWRNDIQLAFLRAERRGRLSRTDWRMLPDAPGGSDTAAWRTYRQALRDVPANTSDPNNPNWPTEPGE
jgi:hypothetical protein